MFASKVTVTFDTTTTKSTGVMYNITV